MANVLLQSKDGEGFGVSIKVAKLSGTIRTMLEDLGMDDNTENVEIPLQNISTDILRRIIQWAEYHQNDPPEPTVDESIREKRTDDIIPWDITFFTVDQGTLFELILAANYLDIKPLLDTTCKIVAKMIKGKTPDEIRKTFNIVNDLTSQESAKIKKENEWCEHPEAL